MSTSFWRVLHFPHVAGTKSRFSPATVVVVARAARDFLRISGFGSLKSENFAGPQGHLWSKLGSPLSKSWKKSWVWVVSRLAKSCIEYVILAGSSFSRCQRQNPDIPRPWQSSWRAQRAIFSRIWAFGTLKSEIFAGPQGHLAKAGLPAL